MISSTQIRLACTTAMLLLGAACSTTALAVPNVPGAAEFSYQLLDENQSAFHYFHWHNSSARVFDSTHLLPSEDNFDLVDQPWSGLHDPTDLDQRTGVSVSEKGDYRLSLVPRELAVNSSMLGTLIQPTEEASR